MSLQRAIAYRNSFQTDSMEYRSMDLFLTYARGHTNPMSKSMWVEKMAEIGCTISVNFLEKKIIRPARMLYDFFGVKRYKGLYLMMDNQDIEESAQFYHDQGDSMNARGDMLSLRLSPSGG